MVKISLTEKGPEQAVEAQLRTLQIDSCAA